MLSISSTQDPVTKGGHVRFQELVPGARTTRHVTIRGAGHFIQEEKPDELAQVCSLLLAPGPWLDDPSGGVLPLMNAARTHARTHGVVACAPGAGPQRFHRRQARPASWGGQPAPTLWQVIVVWPRKGVGGCSCASGDARSRPSRGGSLQAWNQVVPSVYSVTNRQPDSSGFDQNLSSKSRPCFRTSSTCIS